MQFARGTTASLAVTFRDYQGNLTDPDDVAFRIEDPLGGVPVTAGTPNHLSTGLYTLTYLLDENAPLGLWKATWTAIIDSTTLDDDDYFEVISQDQIIAPTQTQIDYQGYVWLPRWSLARLGVELYRAGALTDPDSNIVAATMVRQTDNLVVFSRQATRDDTGLYSILFESNETATPGRYTLTWNYAYGGDGEAQQTVIEIGEASPLYSRLDDDMQHIADMVWVRFADLYDSMFGGPFLQEQFQSRFGRERIVQLMEIALGRMNTISAPHQTYSLTDPGKFPVAKWGGLLSQATYVEVIKHLIRSYTEQPDWPGVNVARADRRDYMQRWEAVLAMEQGDLKDALGHFKVASLGLGGVSVLVAGGIYPNNFGPTRVVGSAASRPRYFQRFFV